MVMEMMGGCRNTTEHGEAIFASGSVGAFESEDLLGSFGMMSLTRRQRQVSGISRDTSERSVIEA